MSRSIRTDYTALRNPMHISEVLAETFRHTQAPEDLTAWADVAPMRGQGVLFCDEVNTEFTSDARPGADWGTWEVPC